MRLNNIFMTLFCIVALLVATQAFALPEFGDVIKMKADKKSHRYTLLDGDNKYTSFCLGRSQTFKNRYAYKVKSVGNTAFVGRQNKRAASTMVKDETKWLYAAYTSGVFASVNNAAKKVQMAILYSQGEGKNKHQKLRYQKMWDYLSSNFSFDDTGWSVVAVNLTRKGRGYSQLIGEAPTHYSGETPDPGPVEAPAPVPEPSTLLLLGTGMAGLAVTLKRKRNQLVKQ